MAFLSRSHWLTSLLASAPPPHRMAGISASLDRHSRPSLGQLSAIAIAGPFILFASLYSVLNKNAKPCREMRHLGTHTKAYRKYAIGESKVYNDHDPKKRPYPREEMWGREVATM